MTVLFVAAASGHSYRTHFIFHSSDPLPTIIDCKAEKREKSCLAAGKARQRYIEQSRRNAQKQGIEWSGAMEEQAVLTMKPLPQNPSTDYTGRPNSSRTTVSAFAPTIIPEFRLTIRYIDTQWRKKEIME
ncbi:hypothetical protein BLNAU_12205 [Blattamonas nauphoetae]|uniref:Uncharacterized protein n=1 Tax=Blattamonas nauphoetae TaxID=2049346 RepID=A0ABQ9XQ07_9EUKA|nr:hypothetical protein BLNAU_12205 [Blattamonas nauphoetae]